MERKIDICHELLEIADKLEPGWSKFRGSILLELQAAMVVQTKRDFEADKLTKAGTQVKINEIYFERVEVNLKKMKDKLFC